MFCLYSAKAEYQNAINVFYAFARQCRNLGQKQDLSTIFKKMKLNFHWGRHGSLCRCLDPHIFVPSDGSQLSVALVNHVKPWLSFRAGLAPMYGGSEQMRLHYAAWI